VFNLVKYRYIFLLVSLVVIIPGLIFLILFGLNVGIDFAGGSNIEVRPQRSFATTNDVKNLLTSLKLSDEQIVLGDNKAIDAKKTVWVRLNTQANQTVQTSIQDALTKKYQSDSKLSVIFTDVPSTGGKFFTLVTISGFGTAPQVSDIRSTLSNLPNGASVTDVTQGSTTQTVSILTKSELTSKDLPGLQAAFLKGDGPYFQIISTSEVGGSVAQETTRNAFFAVLAAAFFILLYIWFSFRKVSKPWRYGACAIIALLHDVLVVVGVFAILGKLFNIQVDALFITALLTVCGFSVHDTIVVFDRIRENMQRRTSETFDQVVNASLIQTMARSLNTSLTVLFTLTALTLFGGASIRSFTLALLIGIFSGTYSSIFNASMLLVIWERGEFDLKNFGRKRDVPASGKGEREGRELARSRT
jgi:preprotein translocase SecF subunit